MDFDFALSTSWSDMDIGSKSAWASELESRGYDVALITPAEGVPDDAATGVFRLPELATDESVSFQEIERRYDIPSLRHLQTTEMAYFALTRETARERTRRLLTALETIFSEHSVEYCVQGRGGELHRLLLHHYVNATGGTAIWQGFSFFEETFSLHTRLDGQWNTYSTIRYDDIPPKDREWAHDYVEEFRDRRKFFSLSNDDEEGDHGYLARGWAALRSISDRLLNRMQPGDPKRLAGRFVKQTGNATLNKWICNTVAESERLCERERYVLYPIQFPAESRLTVFSPEFFDQRSVIRYLVRILPEGVKLFVKPHPHHPGIQPPRFTYELAREDPVEFLHPDMHSHDAITGAQAVTSINNTPGFETILYGVPLLNLGKAFYSQTPGARSINRLSELPESLANAIGEELSEKCIVESVYSLREAAYDGDVGSSDPDDAAECVDGLLEFVETIEE